ncbi:amino acid APC transporter [Terrihabitans soli]|uniref:Amino acid APC transporter n=1 Tax=Terrihabitans soli TaxID=708113 RepID=A0A6S6QVG3_9HYPH|nr:amino acid APC transporter [Terrihabitans soli]
MSVFTLTAFVIGSMIGSGIFSLPQAFGRTTGPLGAILAWCIAGAGMLMIALVFQTLSRRKPELDSGISAYVRAGFGEYAGFLSALGYWTVCCLGDVSYFIVVKSTLGALIPAFGHGNTLEAIFVSSILLWLVHILVLHGIKQAASVNTVVTVAKIAAIVTFILVVIFAFDADLFSADWRGEASDAGGLFNQIRGTMLVMTFVFVGVEGASVYSRYARNRRDVGIATVVGFLSVLTLMVMITLLSYGILARPELATLRNPSMAGVMQAAVGSWGAWFVGIALIVSVSGAYIAWSLLAAEVVWSSSKAELMPRFLSRENRNKVPAAAVWFTNGLIQCILILTFFTEEAFLFALKLTGSMILIPYFLVAAYGLKLAWSGEDYGSKEQRHRDLMQAGLATIYAAGLIYAGGLKFLLLSSIVYALGTPLFIIARREQKKPAFTLAEAGFFILLVIGAGFAVYGLASRTIVV